MNISTSTYRVKLSSTGTRQQRRCGEICECSINGAVRRVIARTPAVIGEGDDQDSALALARAKAEAQRMLRAFTEGAAK